MLLFMRDCTEFLFRVCPTFWLILQNKHFYKGKAFCYNQKNVNQPNAYLSGQKACIYLARDIEIKYICPVLTKWQATNM